MIVLWTLALVLSVFLGAFFASEKETASETENLTLYATANETGAMLDIVKDGQSDYKIVFSTSDSLTADADFALELRSFLRGYGPTIKYSADSAAEEPHEILLGGTKRALSKALTQELVAATPEGGIAWLLAEKDGKLALVASNNDAFTLGSKELLAFATDDGFSVPVGYKKLTTMTGAEDEEYLEALKALNEQFKSEPKLNGSYKSMIGDSLESAYYTENPYDSPWFYPDENQHPRYLLTSENVERIKEMMNEPEYEALFENFWEYVEKDINNGIFPEVVGASGETYRYSEEILAGISARAMAYLLTGNEVYAYEAIVAIKNAIVTLKFTTDIETDVYHGASHVMIVLSAVYDWCYDVMDDTDRWQLIKGTVNCLWPTMEFSYPPHGFQRLWRSRHGPSVPS